MAPARVRAGLQQAGLHTQRQRRSCQLTNLESWSPRFKLPTPADAGGQRLDRGCGEANAAVPSAEQPAAGLAPCDAPAGAADVQRCARGAGRPVQGALPTGAGVRARGPRRAEWAGWQITLLAAWQVWRPTSTEPPGLLSSKPAGLAACHGSLLGGLLTSTGSACDYHSLPHPARQAVPAWPHAGCAVCSSCAPGNREGRKNAVVLWALDCVQQLHVRQ